MALVIYVPTQWVNGTAPAINSTKLNHIENGIKAVTDATLALEVKLASAVPAGMIAMFSGVVIPEGWALCDGTQGTPNLVGKFIIGGNTGDTGVTGGSRDAIVVDHTHTNAVGVAGGHNHGGYATVYVSGAGGSSSITYSNGGNVYHEDAGHTSSTSSTLWKTGTAIISAEADHNHTLTINNAGVSGVDKNLPPYYTLAYIMKLA